MKLQQTGDCPEIADKILDQCVEDAAELQGRLDLIPKEHEQVTE